MNTSNRNDAHSRSFGPESADGSGNLSHTTRRLSRTTAEILLAGVVTTTTNDGVDGRESFRSGPSKPLDILPAIKDEYEEEERGYEEEEIGSPLATHPEALGAQFHLPHAATRPLFVQIGDDIEDDSVEDFDEYYTGSLVDDNDSRESEIVQIFNESRSISPLSNTLDSAQEQCSPLDNVYSQRDRRFAVEDYLIAGDDGLGQKESLGLGIGHDIEVADANIHEIYSSDMEDDEPPTIFHDDHQLGLGVVTQGTVGAFPQQRSLSHFVKKHHDNSETASGSPVPSVSFPSPPILKNLKTVSLEHQDQLTPPLPKNLPVERGSLPRTFLTRWIQNNKTPGDKRNRTCDTKSNRDSLPHLGPAYLNPNINLAAAKAWSSNWSIRTDSGNNSFDSNNISKGRLEGTPRGYHWWAFVQKSIGLLLCLSLLVALAALGVVGNKQARLAQNKSEPHNSLSEALDGLGLNGLHLNAGPPPVPPTDLPGICSLVSVLESHNSYQMCQDLCNQAECCFLPSWDPLSCHTEMNGNFQSVLEFVGCNEYRDHCASLNVKLPPLS